MERLFNDGWEFTKLENGSGLADTQSAVWQAVDIPHDFLIGQENNLYENADGWYRRVLDVPKTWLDKAVLLRFDGVYMDCDVLLNGDIVCTHHYGYTCFDTDLTGRLQAGENVIHVHVRHRSPNSRWYSGAGIYRDVTLQVLPLRHIAPDGTYVTTACQDGQWTLTVETELTGTGEQPQITHTLTDGCGLTICADGEVNGDHACAVFHVDAPHLWSVDDPFCYTLTTACGDQVICENVGFRTIELTTDRGMFLNGKHIKLHGVCLHHDLGCLGSAFHEKAARRQLLAMKEMGVNSLRTSHNPPARQIMDLCDELGILVVDETFDMWQHPKTTYDYARFFDADAADDVAAWVRRDRNHPSLLMWSIGNEIGDTNNNPEQAGKVTQMLCRYVRQHDPKGNAVTTIGSNYMPWAGAQHCAQFIEAVGYNYGEKLYEQHHAAHPEWRIYGSETGSLFSSRGIYKFPIEQSIMSDEDLQCSALGNSSSSWGAKDLRKMIVDDLNCPYSLGQYFWSGIDYIGEPTPYHTRSCYFGLMDTAVFPKDFWYLFKSLWTKAPMVHIGVHWDWNPGQLIDVPVMTNGDSAELFLNGESLGRQQVERLVWEKSRPCWKVPYAPGEIKAVAYDASGCIIAQEVQRTPGDSAVITLQAEDQALFATGKDMTFVTIGMADAQGNPVPNAVDRVQVSVSGAGMLIGLDNGDSTDREGYQASSRRLFSGKLLAVIGAAAEQGTIRIEVTSPGKEAAVLEIPVLPAETENGVSRHVPLCKAAEMPDDVPVRKLELIPLGGKRITKDSQTLTFRVKVYPEEAEKQEIALAITNMKGIKSPCASCTMTDDLITVTGHGDGEIFLRASCNNGYPHPRIISQQEIVIEDLGQPNLNPYGFVSAGLYDVHSGEISNGNEQGIAFARDGASMVGFRNVDFGPVGSDELELPIFALDGNLHELHMWDGILEEGGQLIAVLPYQKPSRWNVYQPETYRLPVRLTGVHTICFSLTEKVHLKGFVFTKQSRAWMPQEALGADAVYGDSFTRGADGIFGIGNNVSLVYENMDFGDAETVMLTIDGCTPLEENPITVRCQNEDGESVTALAQFKGTARGKQLFEVNVLPGLCTVTFVFLPGCQFDFYGFRFSREKIDG